MARLASHRMWKWTVGIFAVLCLSIAYAASGTAPKSGPTIVIDKARAGEHCVEDTAFMRKNHMKLLMHQRDETMHKGIRTEKHSLKKCVSCHASTKDDRVVGSNEHFCQSCHTYAAVSLDCWECHATKAKPAQAAVATTLPAATVSVGGEKK
jgi:hypothetical protein